MSLLEKAYKTYEILQDKAGEYDEGKNPLVPISHMLANAHIEIQLTKEGKFVSAKEIPAVGIIIPITPESASRSGTGAKDRPHPFSDQLMYLSPGLGGNFENYVEQLTEWAESEFSHPKLKAVLTYIKSGTILQDLQSDHVLDINDTAKMEKAKKKMVRWVVFHTGDHDESWKDKTLFVSYIRWYDTKLALKKQGICNIAWDEEPLAESHPKGILIYENSAKLISSNDDKGFTYRGRFATPEEVASIGYYASQKAHNALRYLVSNYGTSVGKRTFLWWNIANKQDTNPLLKFGEFAGLVSNTQDVIVNFRKQLHDTLTGKENSLKFEGQFVVAALEAATTGRLSVTYYSEVGAEDFAKRIDRWYETMAYSEKGYTPSINQIVKSAFGNERGNFIEVDDRLMAENVQRLLHCVIDCSPIPKDIVMALVHKFGQPQAYKEKNRQYVQDTAFAVVKKYRNEKFKEEWTLALDTTCKDRSYLFGRLLAIAEKMEKDTYEADGGRTPNAIKLQAAFSCHPMSTWRILMEKLIPYKDKLAKTRAGSLHYYEKLISEIMENLSPENPLLNTGLSELYLLGYYHQRSDFYKKQEKNENTEE